MADPAVFFANLKATSNALITTLRDLETYQDMLSQDATLAAAAATAGSISGANGRTLVAADITNVASAISQILFTFNSGAPTQKSFIYKIL